MAERGEGGGVRCESARTSLASRAMNEDEESLVLRDDLTGGEHGSTEPSTDLLVNRSDSGCGVQRDDLRGRAREIQRQSVGRKLRSL